MKKFRNWLENNTVYGKFNETEFLSEEIQLSKTFYKLKDDRVLTLRVVEANDVPDILEIQRKCYDGETPWHANALNREIEHNKQAVYLIFHDGEKPVSFIGAWFIRKEAHITNIATIPEYEKKGIATFLIKEIIEFAKQEHFEILTLEVRISNDNAQSLYRTLGFVDGSIKKRYYTSNGEDALNMILYL